MVSRERKTPLYMQVYTAIRGAIETGELKRGQMLPAEKDLGLQYQVDRQTVRRSLELLVGEGLIEKRAGVGSFVKDYPELDESAGGVGTAAFILPGAERGMDRITEPFNAKLFSSIEKQCRAESLHLTYTTVSRVDDLQRLPANVVGVFAVSRVADEVVKELLRRQIPALVINDYRDFAVSIMEDSASGSCDGVNHLLELGHRRIAYLGGSPAYTTSEERYTGYVRALTAAGVAWHEMPRADGDWTFDSGYRAMQEIMEGGPELPSAVFAANDMMAFGAIHAISDAGLSVPDDISVLGFDDIDQSRYSLPPLTTIGVDVELTAHVATMHLLQLTKTRSRAAYKVIIPTRLVVRSSTGPVGGRS